MTGFRRSRFIATVGIALAGCAPVAAAPAPKTGAIPLPPIPPAPPDTALPPYQDRLDRLAELLGTLAFLRNLCRAGDGAAWHDRMQALLAAEGSTTARRDRLAGSYNRGYTSYQLSYRSCTPAAEAVVARALAEGTRITTDVSARFGTP